MLVTLTAWQTRGLRCPDTDVNFLINGNYKRINLVQMPNGTGKSTIIELISAALTGDARYWKAEKVREVNSTESPNNNGLFILKILIEDNEQRIQKNIVFQMDFDFNLGTILYSTISDPTSGLEVGWKAPRELITFLNERCVEVFVFKGDKVQHLIAKDRNDAEASIKAFFGLSHIDDLEHIIENDFKGRQSGVTSEQGFQKRKNVLDKWTMWLQKLEEAKIELEEELKPIRARYDDIKTNVEEILSGQDKNNQTLLDLESTKDNMEKELSIVSLQAFEALRNPLFVSSKILNKMNFIKEKLDTMKLPGTSGEFFKELATQESCICNREIDDSSRKAILENSNTYLSEDHIETINGIKKDTQTYSIQAELKNSSNPFHELRKASADFHLADTRLQRHHSKMKGEATAGQKSIIEELEEIGKEKDLKEARLEHLIDNNGNVREASSGNPEQCKKIPIVKKVIESRQKELAEISNTVQEFEAKEKLKRILKKSCETALGNIKLELKDKSNLKLKRILPGGTPLEILSIDKNIQIGFKGKQQASASGGQNVSIAYSFATSILERSGAQFPLIVDHPVTALQVSARKGLGENLAEICHQFIGFIIDTEKDGFVDALGSNGKDVNYITLFKKISGNQTYIDQLPNNKESIFESDNGIVCTDKDFFNNFTDLTPDMSE